MDLVQDTLERALRDGIPSDVANVRARLATTMHSLFVDRCRAAARRAVHEPPGPLREETDAPRSVDPPEPVWSEVTVQDVYDALDEIVEPFREVYILHTFDHRSYAEIAERLKISRVTVGTRLTRTRKLLRKLLVRRVGVARRDG
jgi:RNA polymerase sigma factor (sigma-70 family)